MATVLDRVTRHRLVVEIASRLRRAILSGELAAGQRLSEVELAERLGVSRTPVREALRMLEQEALVVASPRRGVEVVRLSAADAADLYELREALDGLAARRLAAGAGAEVIAGLADNLDRTRRALERKDMDAFLELNVAFHEMIASCSGNRWLDRFVPVIRMTIQMFHPVLAKQVERAWQAWEEHEQIYRAVRGGDAQGAERSARRHVRNARAALIKALTEVPGARHRTGWDAEEG